MNLTELKLKPVSELIEIGGTWVSKGVARSRKQDVIFGILKAHAKKGEDISGNGVLEILQDGFGFLRSGDSSYLAGPDDIYVSPSQIRRFNLRTGDTISGKSGRRRTANATSRSSRSTRLTSNLRRRPRIRSCSRTSPRCSRTNGSSSRSATAPPRT